MKDHFHDLIWASVVMVLIASNFATVYFFLSGMWSSNIAIEQALRAVVTVEEVTKSERRK